MNRETLFSMLVSVACEIGITEHQANNYTRAYFAEGDCCLGEGWVAASTYNQHSADFRRALVWAASTGFLQQCA